MGHKGFDPSGWDPQDNDDSQQGQQGLLPLQRLCKLGLHTASYMYVSVGSGNQIERGLYLRDEGYDTDTNYHLPQPQKRTTHIHAVTAMAQTSFDLMGPQESKMLALTSTPKGRPVESSLLQMTCRHLSFSNEPPPVVDPNDEEEEEYFPTAPLDD